MRNILGHKVPTDGSQQPFLREMGSLERQATFGYVEHLVEAHTLWLKLAEHIVMDRGQAM